MSEDIKKAQEQEDEILKRIEMSPLKNFVFTKYNQEEKDEHQTI